MIFKNDSIYMNKTPGGLELVVCGSQDRHFNHWAMMLVNQCEWYKQFIKTFKSASCDGVS